MSKVVFLPHPYPDQIDLMPADEWYSMSPEHCRAFLRGTLLAAERSHQLSLSRHVRHRLERYLEAHFPCTEFSVMEPVPCCPEFLRRLNPHRPDWKR